MALSHQPMVKKPRSKVSRACENCRRRKIKCTGNQPCNNCVTYQCECIFSKGTVSSISNISQITPASSENLTSVTNCDSTVERASSSRTSSNSAPLEKNSCTEKDVEEKTATDATIFDPVMDSVSENIESMTKNVYSIKSMNEKLRVDNQDCKADMGNSSAACDICDLTKTDVAALPDLTPVKGDNGLYQDDMEFQEKISEMQAMLKRLKPLSHVGPNIKKAISDIYTQVELLIDSWEPKYDCNKYKKTVQSGFERSKSVETHLMKNKYTDQVYLTSFAVWTDTSKKKNVENPFFGNRPLVDEIFGLYSPLQGLSLRGIGFFFQRCTSGPESKEKSVQLKESLYLLLRFFDICVDHINQSCISIANPLVSYLQRRNLLGTVPGATPTGLSPTNSNNGTKDLVLGIIDRLPQPFVKNLTGVTTEVLRQTMYDDFAMFDLVLRMYDCHKRGFEALMMKVTSRDANNSTETMAADTQSFVHFCEEEEMLLALCYNYYNSTMYHFSENAGNLNYFDLLLSLLETQKWLDEHYGFEKVLGVAISYAYNIGLSRWEFYVGLDEETAERKRRSWWKLYCLEKFWAFKKGRQSSIDDDKMNCLLPEEFRKLGFFDNKNFLSEMTSTPRSWAFDNMSIACLKFYGECAMAQAVSQFYSKVLYADRYTSIKNTAKPAFLKERLIGEVFQELHLLRDRFDMIKSQTKRLFDIAASSTNGAIDLFLSRYERSQAAHYALLHGSLYFTVTSSTNNLVARLLVNPKDPSVVEHYSRYSVYLRESWREMTNLILSLDDDYTLSRVFEYYGVVSMPIVSRAFCDATFARSSDELIMFCRVFRRLQSISLYHDNKDNKTVVLSKAYQIYVRILTFLAINIHSIMLGFVHVHNMSREKLIETVKEWAPDVADVPSEILNPKSSVYEPLMKPIQKSGFHLNVRRMLERDKDGAKANKLYPKSAFQLMPADTKGPMSPSIAGLSASLISPEGSRCDVSPYPGVPANQVPSVAQNLLDASRVPSQESFSIPHDVLRQENGSGPMRIPQPNNVSGPLSDQGYHLGTLEEFINNGDLNDLCNTLWSDLYTDGSEQNLRPSDLPGSFSTTF